MLISSQVFANTDLGFPSCKDKSFCAHLHIGDEGDSELLVDHKGEDSHHGGTVDKRENKKDKFNQNIGCE